VSTLIAVAWYVLLICCSNRPPPTQAGPPPSFQTNINRTKTRKWTEAKQYNYDGDDWGDVDPYDEYGSYPEPSQAAQPTQAMHQRQQSFDRGDERRVFSAGAGPTPGPSRDYPPPQQQQYGRGDGMNAQMGQGQQARGGRRDFSQPSQVPQPLHAQQSPAAIRPSSAGVAFPPRKSSMGPTETQAQGPAPTQPSVAPAMGTDKPLPANVPFIRPSDIYKRMQEAQEKERQSMDSSRPSMDSLQRPGSSGGEQNWLPANVTEMSQQTGRGQSLGTVVEGAESAQNQAWSHDTPQRNQSLPQAVEQDHHSIYELSATPKKMPMADQSLENTPERVPLQTSLPRVSRIASGFGDDFWSSTGLGADTQTNSEAPTAETWRDGMMKPAAPSESPQAEELLPATSYNPPPGLQTVVSQAFDRTDDNFTPISQSNSQTLGSEISRSNTDSTAGISPIMSRVPSAATAESRQRANEHHEPTVTPIAEETLREISTPGHSRNASNDTTGPTHRQEMYAPSPKGSPARAPVLANTRRLSHPMTAEVGHVDEQHEQIPIGPDYAEREVDLAQQATSHNQAGSPELIAAASDARAGFLQTHAFPEPSSPQANTRSFPRNTATLTSPTVTSPTISGRESPAAGRVRDLAGRFNEIQDASRRNSQTSLSSKASLSSWKQGDEGLALRKTRTLESPVMESSGTFGQSKDDLRPQLAPQASFRPHLPGEWVSTTNLNVQTPPAAPSPTLSSHSDTPKAPMTATERTEQVDFTPTTARRSLRQAGPQDAMEDSHSPIDALKAAGAALAASLMGSAGTVHHESRDFAQPAAPSEEDMEAGRAPPRRSGDVHMRPLISDMLDMSVASSIAPTPAANYGLGSELPERSSTYFPRVEEPSSHRVPGSSEDEDDYDYDYDDEEMESDRLRREIERSLTPQPPRAQHDEESEDEWERDDEELRDQVDRDQQALDAPQHLEQHQRAENIPVEEIVPAMPHQHEQQIVVPTIHGPEHDSRPGMLDQRFSWEERKNRDSTTAMFNPAALGPELDRPRTPLHVVNANVSEESLTSPAVEHVPEPAPVVEMDPDNLSSPVEQMRELEPVAIPNEATSTQPDSHRDQVPREHEEEETTTTSPPHSPVLASPRSNDQKALPISPGELGQEQREHARPATATTVDGQPRIVPFREILAIRDASTRIEAYQNTRQQFADMDTGLRSWLSTTIAAHPEHAHIATDSPNLLSSTASIRHKPAPSIMKIAKGLGGSRADEAQSVASPTKSTDPSSPQQNNAYGVNVDKMSSKGKDLLQTAGKLGGKGMTGAKGWLAKGRQKLRESGSGVDKVD